MSAEKATSLRRGLELLLALGEEEALAAGGLGVVRLAELVGGEKTRVSRTLQTLAAYDLVERDPDTLAYRTGWRLFALASRFADARLLDAAPVFVERLVAEFDEGAHLSVRSGERVVTVVSRAPSRMVAAADAVGRTVALHCTSAGRALLLDHDRAALARDFGPGPLPRPGPGAPRDLAELERRIAAAREAGYAIADEESELGLVAVAAPVRDFSGRIVAALNVSAPKFRFAARLPRAGIQVREAADELSAVLGRRPQPMRKAG
jgi:IclR family transcriptional regulator, KDG regulon repressor